MKVKSLASGSGGNCYLLDDGETSLLLECGLRWPEIQRGLNFETSAIKGCFVSHEHKDHCKGILDLLKRGYQVFLSQGTADNIPELKQLTSHHRLTIIQRIEPLTFDKWRVMPFEVQHDAGEPLGFLIFNQRAHKKILYATDTHYLRYTYSGLTHILVETNYSEEIIMEKVKDGQMSAEQAKRVRSNHFSLEGVMDFLKANDLSDLEETWLLHLSAINSDEKMFKEEVQKLTGKPVYITTER